MIPVTLKQFQALVAVGRHGTLRAAADALGLSQPSLSAQLDALEGQLSARLTERGRRGSLLTPLGREVAERAARILADVVELGDYVVEATRSLAGMIRLGVKASVGPYLMPQVVGLLHRAHPDLRLFIREDIGERLIDQLCNGMHDLALVETPLDDHALNSRTLFEEPLDLVCASDHPFAALASVQPERLRGARVLGFSGKARYHHAIGAFCSEVGARLIEEYESSSLDALRLMAGSGLGLCFLPRLYVRSEIVGRGDVAAVPLVGSPLRRRLGLAWRRRSEPSLVVTRIERAFCAVIEREFSDLR